MLNKKMCVMGLGIIIIILALITCVLPGTIYSRSMDPSESAEAPTTTEALPPIRIISRREWLAQPPKDDLTELNVPVGQVIIMHTASRNCRNQTECGERIRMLQNYQMSHNGFSDIGYNFLIGGDGNIYEGRGWTFVGAFLIGQNAKSQGIAFVGNYNRDTPTEDQMDALDGLLANGIRNGYLNSSFKLFGARQWQATESPGQHLYDLLKSNEHWTDVLSNSK
ncbi:peptidoglycan-recognition protein SD-like [Armigeres subalbatus]|uniref:peptidoglycan-recognition protein SD-like n=1 Tax=Armigeres subalbatus TaxID=124917 RepID=UPI002ED2FAA3